MQAVCHFDNHFRRPPHAVAVCEHRASPSYYASYFYKRWRGARKQGYGAALMEV